MQTDTTNSQTTTSRAPSSSQEATVPINNRPIDSPVTVGTMPPTDMMNLPDYLGGFLPTQQGHLNYLAKKMQEAQETQHSLKCPYCAWVLGNAGSHKRHVGACRQWPEKVAQMIQKSTCTQCGRVLKTPQAMVGHRRFCVVGKKLWYISSSYLFNNVMNTLFCVYFDYSK